MPSSSVAPTGRRNRHIRAPVRGPCGFISAFPAVRSARPGSRRHAGHRPAAMARCADERQRAYMTIDPSAVRIGVDIGGTFTDIAVEIGQRYVTTKVLTTPRAPEQAVMRGIAAALAQAGVKPSAVDLVIHGTTLATYALIERKGARTAMIGTEGHRDTLELGYEDRFSEYDVFIEKP